MKCPYCNHESTDVLETRDSEDLSVTRRRRTCATCDKRFTTYERVESVPITVIKKDERRETFDREKLRRGIWRASGKTTITAQHIERIVDEVERELISGDTTEVASKRIGELVARRLKKLDKIAYIRFASVFRRFVDIEDFEKEVKKLL
ncbi:transcriptional regulator NrdR [Candidatus Gottesmanbacteria bacterium RIFCSPLOWO2_01_FULL_48_11]|uniref:Transcriptional repressor NrdR n=3 Tax=Candidatus Gottesmaniibacteriota TaxID=1752720 RepID=A0A0G1XMU2_9BACT|nr:MAG: Transcriptional repressor NrdR [Candidatus Gottesmanbacteria bacterium GW2011_GWA2_47_9]KKU95630.1 MAG: Transcriptional repressor NrdR [Candidatus Gottesmanbacteria bacterium GW2011_GWA1_48_13]OGG28508.1 MAG: transcriptional regulator NrdR [Candidatus Gottesmanbacteria bacterium RIFCSPLOWO2_01_FULL_48_11]